MKHSLLILQSISLVAHLFFPVKSKKEELNKLLEKMKQIQKLGCKG